MYSNRATSTSLRVCQFLRQIIEWSGKPLMIRVDYGPECATATLIMQSEKQRIALT